MLLSPRNVVSSIQLAVFVISQQSFLSQASSQTNRRGATLDVDRFHGRVGNILAQIGHVFAAAEKSGAQEVGFEIALRKDGPTSTEVANKREFLQLFDIPAAIRLKDTGNDAVVFPPACQTARNKVRLNTQGRLLETWYATPCADVPAKRYHELLGQYLRPFMVTPLVECASGSARADDVQLTVHLNEEDWADVDLDKRASKRIWLSPPCPMYENIIIDGNYKRVLVLSDKVLRKHPCLRWFRGFADRSSVTILFQSEPLIAVACEVLQARSLVFSYSAFVHNLVLLSTHLKRLYTRGAFDPHWLIDCNAWPGVEVVRYDVPAGLPHETVHNETLRGASLWMATPAEISGPFRCDPSDCESSSEHSPRVCKHPGSAKQARGAVVVSRLHGRIGNNLAQFGHALTLAEKSSAALVNLGPAMSRYENSVVEAGFMTISV